MRAAILTVSTSVAAGEGEDRSGPVLADRVRAAGVDVIACDVVSDDASEVATWLAEHVRAGIELVLTTGGTGFTPDDVTPEATRAVIEREAPGIAEAMRAEAIRHTPMGMLSRGVAGMADRTLIINFPGSPKAIEELFGVVAPVLEHAIATLHREPGDRTPRH